LILEKRIERLEKEIAELKELVLAQPKEICNYTLKTLCEAWRMDPDTSKCSE